MLKKKQLSTAVALVVGFSMLSGMVSAHEKNKPYELKGNCAELPASRTTEFHGNPVTCFCVL
ncbi:hypothetical protein MNBD_GAMMA08-2260 [hydrothermal vent metagenome]|uniref:Uncharacterized protein n=1 Tax=hydrothermal vent metagenome TaxID=652676 RepID=A0A3B0XJG4_9ZZZZ